MSSEFSILGDVHLVEFMYLECTRMPGENYRRQFRSLLCSMRHLLSGS